MPDVRRARAPPKGQLTLKHMSGEKMNIHGNPTNTRFDQDIRALHSANSHDHVNSYVMRYLRCACALQKLEYEDSQNGLTQYF